MGDKWYALNDGWFTFFVNKRTGEKKIKLEEGDNLVDANLDDFTRD